MRTRFFLYLFSVATLVLSCSNDDDEQITTPQPEAFTMEGAKGMSTGTTSTGGTSAPAGFTWSEIKSPQSTWGLSGTIPDRMLADDFVVPSGQKWSIQNIYFYAYQTNFSGITFPLNELYFEIYSSDPSVAGAVKIYGDLTSNRYVSSEETNMYRILQGQTDNTTRKIYKVKTQTPDLNLSAGTYWIKWGSKASSGTHYYPQLPYDGTKVNNAKQFLVSNSTWTNLNDSGQTVSLPIEMSGTKLPQ